MQLITVYIISCSNNSDMFWLVCLAIETKTSYANHSCLNRRVVVMCHVALQVSCVSCVQVPQCGMCLSCCVANVLWCCMCPHCMCHMSCVATRVLCCVSHGVVLESTDLKIEINSLVKVIPAFQIKH